jgi:hypothetical protein
MISPERRTVQELVMRYKLEPHLHDVYVEGVFDSDVFTSALSTANTHDFTFYPIDTVTITQEDLKKYNLTDGNKQRVIALASELACVVRSANYLCLVDRDLDHWFKEHPTVPRLKWTRFCSIESHFIAISTFSEIAVLICKAKIPGTVEMFNSFIEVLKYIYSLRLADFELELGLSWVPLRKYLRQEHSSVSLDHDGYVAALVNKNNRSAYRESILDSAKSWSERFSSEHRPCIRGHDFTELLAWVVSKYQGISAFREPEAIARLLVLAAKGSSDIINELEYRE